MKDSELIVGNGAICEMLGWKSEKPYVYQVPNLFPEIKEDAGFTEFNTQEIGFHLDWNILIGAYNEVLKKIAAMRETQKELLQQENSFLVQFAAKNFFGLFEGQLWISSCWQKLVDISVWYNSVKHL